MNELLQNMPREFRRVWLWCMLVPLPILVFWRSHDGRFLGLCLFFTASVTLVVYAFSGNCLKPLLLSAQHQPQQLLWRERLSVVGLFLLISWAIFSAVSLLLNDVHDLINPILALASLIPSLCIAPYYALRTQKPLAAVVFTMFSLGSMKLVAGSVTCLVYGWHADEAGRTAMTWAHPDLIVCAFLTASSVLSMIFYTMGKKRFYSICNHGGFEESATLKVKAHA